MTETTARQRTGGESVAQPDGRRYHYILTLQWRNAIGIASNTAYGTWRVRPGDTRWQVYLDILASVGEELHAPDAATLFFALEPDEMEATR